MARIDGYLMSKDKVVAEITDSNIISFDDALIPLYLKRTKNIEEWLSSRAIDKHRVNSRLLKKVLRLNTTDDVDTVLKVNAATITDTYWFKPKNTNIKYGDVKFKENYFDKLALYGDPDSFSKTPSKTPELTNIGSFEKCWRLINNKWYLYKSGNENEIFSELFICKLGEKLNLNMAHYEIDGKYICSIDFTDNASINYEPISSLVGDNDDYKTCFETLNNISKDLAKQYLLLIWMDSICFNMDRHTNNFGLLRNIETGKILSLAPNFDNNVALIANGYPSDISRNKDGLINFFKDFINNSNEALKLYKEINLPLIDKDMINKCLNEIPLKVDREYIISFILNGQDRINNILR